MSNKLVRRILENQRKQEDSGLQIYSTEPPGAMGEKCARHDGESDEEYAERVKKAKAGGKDAVPEEMEFTIDESGPFNEGEWMSLDEMELECGACADKMRERKMTRIKRSEAQECAGRFGKKAPEGK